MKSQEGFIISMSLRSIISYPSVNRSVMHIFFKSKRSLIEGGGS